eukprot:CAMPEP_0198243506 /NCGR_PEP_ID=MMETSP1446-20131203/28445_1 /TAXON_ID=1461542 ORGANISM="Unidentified sp, Strain CCMP2111" /NCGR_SAMPLE_ID=MMETSP1446 /ASSEMBLY_ACC=CAM_ASM_001112 /LENGTH=32 /DNA_ID= /DNA_START= /DNA_END= /DNA_ORIENTATION=
MASAAMEVHRRMSPHVKSEVLQRWTREEEEGE